MSPSFISPTEEAVRRRTGGDTVEEREEKHTGERRLPTKRSARASLINSTQEKTEDPQHTAHEQRWAETSGL